MPFSCSNTGNTDFRETEVQQPNTAATLSTDSNCLAFSANSGQFEAGVHDDRLKLPAHDAALRVLCGDQHQHHVFEGRLADSHGAGERMNAALPGDMTLDNDDLRVTEAKGPVHVTTHSKDIDLSQISGDSDVEDRNGTISVEPAGPYSVEARNNKGDVNVTLPPNASATVNGRTHNGEVLTDFNLSVTGDEDKTVTGKIGSGAAHIELSTDNGDLHIKKGTAGGSAPTAAAAALKQPTANT